MSRKISKKKTRDLISRTNVENPAEEDVQELREWFKENPYVWEQAGNMSKVATAQIVGSIQRSAFVKEAQTVAMKKMRSSLAGTDPTPIETMLVDQVMLTFADYHWAQLAHHNGLTSSTSFKNADYLERRLNGAHNRYMRALTTLARVRRMGFNGPMQINIGKNQNIVSKASN